MQRWGEVESMTEDEGRDPARTASARALLALATEFTDRAQAAEAALLTLFSARAAALVAEVGPLVIDDDDDERLVLGADGRLTGEVLDQDTGSWLSVETPQDVVLYYDPTDIFLDLADALTDRFPELDAAELDAAELDATIETAAHPLAPTGAAVDEAWASDLAADLAPRAEPESATLTMLKDLRRSGALSEPDFERLREQLRL